MGFYLRTALIDHGRYVFGWQGTFQSHSTQTFKQRQYYLTHSQTKVLFAGKLDGWEDKPVFQKMSPVFHSLTMTKAM